MNCPNCQTPNADTSRFCRGCGTALAATADQGRTVVMSGTAPARPAPAPIRLSDDELRKATQRAQRAFGSAPVARGPAPVTRSMAGQREHLVLSNDISGSMAEDYDDRRIKLDAVKKASVTMVVNKADIDPDDAIGVVAFDHTAEVLIPISPLASHKPQIIQAIQSMQIGGGTDINEGLKAARNLFDWSRRDVVRRIVLLTDGHGGHPLRTAEDLKSRGVVIDVIGIGPSPSAVDEKLLKKVASVVGGETHYWFIKDQQTLVRTYTQLAAKSSLK